MKAVWESFHPKSMDLTKKRSATEQSKVANEGGQTTPPSPQERGKQIHRILAKKIKNGHRDGREGEMLKAMEDTFHCKFIRAEVCISGYAVRKSQADLKSQPDFWNGKMDAVAILQQSSNPEDVPEIFVVDWKTSSTGSVLPDWWTHARDFKDPLYQCLVYRELLQAHLEFNNVKALVGIMLVPFNQSQHETLMPGLCMDFKEMDKKGLLDGIKDYQWFSVLDESIYFNTIKLPCKLFKEGFDPAVYVDESTNSLKDDALLKDILSDNATVADLHQVLGLRVLKVEDIKKEKTRAEKDPNKTSVIETAKATEDKTNE